jgi:hypothetical protein
MDFAFFYEYYPDLAINETRSLTITNTKDNVPIGDYGFCEMFCTDPKCDCRRVILNVSDSKFNSFAMIGYGWETEKFYRNWFNSDRFTTDDIKEFMGPTHHNGIVETEYADFFLNFFKTTLLYDNEYIQRIKTHYRMVKNIQKKKRIILKGQ